MIISYFPLDDFGAPQPGASLDNVVGALMQSLPLRAPPPSHAIIQHSLSLNGRSTEQGYSGICTGSGEGVICYVIHSLWAVGKKQHVINRL